MPVRGTRMAIHLLILMGVAKLGVVGADQSEDRVQEDQPIRELGAHGVEGVQTPEVVLQLKYDGGALDRIYLAQYRQGRGSSDPSVPIRDSLCSDLCHSGLGGEGCGSMCQALVPVGLETFLHHQGENSSEIQQNPSGMGMPRRYVCPVLCANNLGEPLCNCGEVESLLTPDWPAVCSAFCKDDAYVLRGCPTCSIPVGSARSSRVLTTNDGWAAWCGVQCRQGHGGAACNCDRTPFQ